MRELPGRVGTELLAVGFAQQLDRNAGKQRQLYDYRYSKRRLYRKRIAFNIGAAERRNGQLWHESDDWHQRGDFHCQRNRNHRNYIGNNHRHVRDIESYNINFADDQCHGDAELLVVSFAQQLERNAGKQRQLYDYRDSERRIYRKRNAFELNSAFRRYCLVRHQPDDFNQRSDFHSQLNRNDRNINDYDHRRFRKLCLIQPRSA